MLTQAASFSSTSAVAMSAAWFSGQVVKIMRWAAILSPYNVKRPIPDQRGRPGNFASILASDRLPVGDFCPR